MVARRNPVRGRGTVTRAFARMRPDSRHAIASGRALRGDGSQWRRGERDTRDIRLDGAARERFPVRTRQRCGMCCQPSKVVSTVCEGIGRRTLILSDLKITMNALKGLSRFYRYASSRGVSGVTRTESRMNASTTARVEHSWVPQRAVSVMLLLVALQVVAVGVGHSGARLPGRWNGLRANRRGGPDTPRRPPLLITSPHIPISSE